MNRQAQQGFSIIELLIAVLLGLILTVGLISIFISSKQGYRVQESRSRMQENARFASDYLARAVRLADFWGSVRPDQVTSYAPLTYGGNGGCSNGWLIDPQNGLRGYEGDAGAPVTGFPAGCFTNYVDNSDVLVVRYGQPDAETDTATLDAAITSGMPNGNFFVRVLTGRRAAVFDITGAGYTTAKTDMADQVDAPGAVLNYPLRTEIYYLGEFDPAPPGGETTPSLYYTRNRRADVEATPLVEGIEMMQMEYGVDSNGDLLADRYQSAEAVNTANSWGRVVSVRVSLIARGDVLDGFIDGSSYPMAGGMVYTPPVEVQKFQRLQVLKEIQVRNRVKLR